MHKTRMRRPCPIPFAVPPRIDAVELSEILKISELADALKREGSDIITLGTGEPDFPTPEHVIEAAHKAALAGETTYTLTAGTLDLRHSIAEACQRDNGYRPEVSEIIVCTGAKQVLYNAFAATLDPGDEVLIVAPYWTSYPDIITVCDGKPVVLPTTAETGFRITHRPASRRNRAEDPLAPAELALEPLRGRLLKGRP